MSADGRTDDGRKVITIAHPEQSSGELKIQTDVQQVDNQRDTITTDKRGIHIIFFLFLYKNICCGTH